MTFVFFQCSNVFSTCLISAREPVQGCFTAERNKTSITLSWRSRSDDLSFCYRVDSETCMKRLDKASDKFSLQFNFVTVGEWRIFEFFVPFDDFKNCLSTQLVVRSSETDPNLFVMKPPPKAENKVPAEHISEAFPSPIDVSEEVPLRNMLHKFRGNVSQFLNTIGAVGRDASIGFTSCDDTANFFINEESTSTADFEKRGEDNFECINQLPEIRTVTRTPSLTVNEIESNHLHGISNVDFLRERIFHGGMEHELRPFLWKYLLGYYLWDATEIQNRDRRETFAKEYYAMKNRWMTMTDKQVQKNSAFRENRSMIEKDVFRTDRTVDIYKDADGDDLRILNDILMTFCEYNWNLGYVQGMNDLLAPIHYVMRNEIDSFWCFAFFVQKIEGNYTPELPGLMSQFNCLMELLKVLEFEFYEYLREHGSPDMLFCVRWLLIWFKREFTYEDVMILWEVCWTQHIAGHNFILLITSAIFRLHRREIMRQKLQLSGIIKFVNDLSGKLDLVTVLTTAEEMYLQLCDLEPGLLPLHVCADLRIPVKTVTT